MATCQDVAGLAHGAMAACAQDNHLHRNQGLSPRDAIYVACVVRFRPIMMTTMVAILAA